MVSSMAVLATQPRFLVDIPLEELDDSHPVVSNL